MQEFYITMKELIQKNGIDSSLLIHQTQIDRSTLYKYMNGKRLPTIAHLNLLANCMKLSPLDRQLLQESFHFSKLGASLYYQRKNIENFFLDFPQPLKQQPTELTIHTDSDFPFIEPLSKPLKTMTELNTYVYHLIHYELSRKDGEILLYVQPDYDFLFQLLSVVTSEYHTPISHILYLNTKNQFNHEHKLFNLQYLRKILPTSMNNLDYNVFYYYNNTPETSEFEGLRNFIVTRHGVIQFASDYKNGMILTSPDSVSFFRNLFLHYKTNTSLLLQKLI